MSPTELYAYLDERVFGAASLKGHEQRPVMWTMAAEKGEFVFFTSAKGAAAPPTPVPGVALSQAEQELKALEEQEQQVAEQKKLAAIQQQIEEKRKRIEEEKRKLEVASLPSYSAPKQTGREMTGKDGAPMVLVPEGEFLLWRQQPAHVIVGLLHGQV